MADLPDLLVDPCGRATALRAERDTMVLGGRESLVRTRTFDNERELRYAKGDTVAIDALIREADTACALLIGMPNPRGRRVMRGGSFGDGNPPYGT